MTNLTSILDQLEEERIRLVSQLETLNNAISALNATGNTQGHRRISTAGRPRIAAAQGARWAKIKGQKVVSITTSKGRAVSTAARRKMAAAQKARWGRWKRAQKRSA